MRKLSKILILCLLCITIVVAGIATYIKFALPNVGEPENITVERTFQRIERGRYLTNSVLVCMDCHSKRDWTLFSGPLVPKTLGQGGEVFDQRYGFPGSFHARNITPSGIGDWTDGELLRTISTGVDRKGKALFPVMPYANYGKMDREDLFAVIAYIRGLTPIKNVVQPSTADFPMNFILNTIPTKATFGQLPSTNDILARGTYLFNAANCNGCHTKEIKGQKIKGMELAGGFEFPLPTGGKATSANITPDTETGIGNWTEAAFLKRFKYYADSSYQNPKVEKGTANTVMPWTMYATMEEADLKAIYAYLKTMKPIKNVVVKFEK